MTTPASLTADDFARGDEVAYHFTVPGLPDVGTLANHGVVLGTHPGVVYVTWYGGGDDAVFADWPVPLVNVQGRVSELVRTGETRLRWLESEGR